MRILIINKYFILTLFLGLFGFNTSAQYYSSGQEPAKTKWRSIKTSTHRFIFPDFFETEAQRAAAIIEYTALNDTFTLRPKFRPIDVVLHPYTTISNAVVPWAPARIDYYTVPPQDSYSQDWFEQLAIHEHRHVLQYNSMKKGFGKFLYYLMGQQSSALLLGTFVPFWAIEGDAVAAETALSRIGRGRLPSFEMPLKAQILEKGIYKYDKAVLGSYKDFTPDHYILGYHLVGNGLVNYGNKFLEKPLKNIARLPFMVVPFSEGIRKQTTLTKVGYYNATLNEFRQKWEKEIESAGNGGSRPITVRNQKTYTSYRKPVLSGQRIFAMKKTLDEVEKIVEILPDGKDRVVFVPGFIHPESITISGNIMAWVENRFDMRWQTRDYSVVRLLNLSTGQSHYLTHKTRYFSPSVSPDGSEIVVAEVTPENRFSLKILDIATGNVAREFKTSENYFLMTPTWSEDGQSVVVTALGKEGKSFLIFDSSGNYRPILPFSTDEINRPVMQDGYVYYSASYSGIDNIYRVNISTSQIEKMTHSEFGAFDPVFNENGSELYYSDYTPEGYQIARKAIDKAEKGSLSDFQTRSPSLAVSLAKTTNRIFDFKETEGKMYPVKKYSKLAHLFNFHSWGPFSVDADNMEFTPGVSVLSQNVLNTSFINAGYQWDLNQETGKYYVKYSYQGFYPVFDFSFDYGLEKGYARRIDTVNQEIITWYVPIQWNETNFKSAVRLPLSFSSGKWRQGIQPTIQYSYSRLDIIDHPEIQFTRDIVKSFENELVMSNQIKSTQWDWFPKWGQTVRLYYRVAPFDPNWTANLFAVTGNFYFPGIAKHHGFKLNLAYQERNVDGFIFSDYITYPRGYTQQYSTELTKVTLDYWLPLLYPDFSVTSLAYIKRLSANVFYDYAISNLSTSESDLQSMGVDLIANVNLLRFFAPFELGLRSIYRPEYADFQFMFIYSINFSLF